MRSLPAFLGRTLFVLVLIPLLSLLAVVAHAQDTTVVVPADPGAVTTIAGALAIAALALVPWLSAKLYDGVKTIFPFIDRLPAIVHQFAAPFLGLIFGSITGATGVALLTDLHGITPVWIGALLNAGVMAGIKRYEKSKQPADTTVVLESSRASTGTVPTRPHRDI